MPATPGSADLLYTKRSLLALSHGMERSLEVGPDERVAGVAPLVVALFQRPEYFEAEEDRYQGIAEAGGVCIVGFAGARTERTRGVTTVPLVSGESLAQEWALVVIDGALGITLVAHDVNDIAEGEPTLEGARLFRATWSFSPTDAAREARRILECFGERLDAAVRARAMAAIARAESSAPSLTERRLAAVTELLVTSIEAAHQRSAVLRLQLGRERERSEQDPLTGLHNRLYLERFLHSPVSDSPLTVTALLVDVDGLKAINDSMGHLAGDAALAAVADLLTEVTRPQDVVVRLGGDEFLVVLPGLDATAGVRVGERIVRHLTDTHLAVPWQSVVLSVSVGVAEAGPNRIPIAELDKALYRVKRSGKGHVCLVDEPA